MMNDDIPESVRVMKEWLQGEMQDGTIVRCHDLASFGHGYKQSAYDVAQTMLKGAGWDYYIGLDAWVSTPNEYRRYRALAEGVAA